MTVDFLPRAHTVERQLIWCYAYDLAIGIMQASRVKREMAMQEGECLSNVGCRPGFGSRIGAERVEEEIIHNQAYLIDDGQPEN